MLGLQQHGAEHRGQGEGNDSREDDGNGHRDGELPVENPHGPGHKGDGNENGGHHQGNRNDGAADFVHYRLRGAVGTEILLFHFCVDGLHHYDGVIHHNADGQDQGEEGDEIDVHPE